MPELMKYLGYGLICVFMGILGAGVFIYYIIRCVLHRDDWDEAKTELDDWGDSQYP